MFPTAAVKLFFSQRSPKTFLYRTEWNADQSRSCLAHGGANRQETGRRGTGRGEELRRGDPACAPRHGRGDHRRGSHQRGSPPDSDPASGADEGFRDLLPGYVQEGESTVGTRPQAGPALTSVPCFRDSVRFLLAHAWLLAAMLFRRRLHAHAAQFFGV